MYSAACSVQRTLRYPRRSPLELGLGLSNLEVRVFNSRERTRNCHGVFYYPLFPFVISIRPLSIKLDPRRGIPAKLDFKHRPRKNRGPDVIDTDPLPFVTSAKYPRLRSSISARLKSRKKQKKKGGGRNGRDRTAAVRRGKKIFAKALSSHLPAKLSRWSFYCVRIAKALAGARVIVKAPNMWTLTP